MQSGIHRTRPIRSQLKAENSSTPYLVNNCAHTLVVLVCVSSALVVRSFLPRFFLHGVLLSSFHVHPCLFASRALELMSAQFPLM